MSEFKSRNRTVSLAKKRFDAFSLSTQAPIVQKLDGAINWINLSPMDNTISFHNTYPLVSNSFSGKHYPMFEQQGSGVGASATYCWGQPTKVSYNLSDNHTNSRT